MPLVMAGNALVYPCKQDVESSSKTISNSLKYARLGWKFPPMVVTKKQGRLLNEFLEHRHEQAGMLLVRQVPRRLSHEGMQIYLVQMNFGQEV
jgi:hypothetical protein